MSNQLKTETSETSDSEWAIVREAITERWPHINRDELAECKDDACELVDFVKKRVGDSVENVQSLVKEFAPDGSMADRVSSAASEHLQNASESAQFAYMRADECIAERPTQAVLASFVTGVVLGAAVTALFLCSRPEPSTWDRVKSRSRF